MLAWAVALLDGASEGGGDFLGAHPGVVRLLLLGGIFAFGYYEASVFQHKASACTAWLFCLFVIAAWIASPPTTVRIGLAAVVLAAGSYALLVYYRRAGRFG